MKEFQIIFSGPMIRAIFAGTKTQTRRILSSRNSLVNGHGSWDKNDWVWAYKFRRIDQFTDAGKLVGETA